MVTRGQLTRRAIIRQRLAQRRRGFIAQRRAKIKPPQRDTSRLTTRLQELRTERADIGRRVRQNNPADGQIRSRSLARILQQEGHRNLAEITFIERNLKAQTEQNFITAEISQQIIAGAKGAGIIAKGIQQDKIARAKRKIRERRRIKKTIKIVDSQPGKRIVTLPTGKKFQIAKKGRVIVPASFAGNKLTFIDGRLIQIKQKIKSSIPKIKKKIINFSDIISGGKISRIRLKEEQNNINDNIELFNQKFGGKKLGEKEFKNAEIERKKIQESIKSIDKRKEELQQSKKAGFGRLLFGADYGIETIKIKRENLQRLREEKSTLTKELSTLKRKNNQGIITRTRINLKQKLLRAKGQEITDAIAGKIPRKFAGTFPIIPAASLPQSITAIKFVGTQKRIKGGKIITDIVFTTSKGRIGAAKGLSVQKGKKVASVVLGRSGKIFFKLPSGKIKLRGITSFIGREIGRTKQQTTRIAKTITLLNKKGKALGAIKSSKNIKVLAQANIGQIGSFRGKIQTGGLIGTKLKQNTLISASQVLTKNQISKIVGKTITTKSGRAIFAGLIKGTKTASTKGGKLIVGGRTISKVQQVQYAKALKQVSSIVSGALAEGGRTAVIAKKGSAVLAEAINLIQKATASAKPTQELTKLKKAAITKQTTITKTKQTTKPIVATTTATKTTSKTKQTTKIKQAERQQSTQKSTQTTQQKLAQKTKALQTTKQIAQLKTFATVRGIPFNTLFSPIFILLKGRKRRSNKEIIKRIPVYAVFTKVRGKFVRVRIKPLIINDAKDVLAYKIDNSLSRTGRIKPLMPTGDIGRIPAKMKGYFNKHKKKFRTFRIKKGRKFVMQFTIIERKKYIGDTRKEQRQLRGIPRRKRRIPKKKSSIPKKRAGIPQKKKFKKKKVLIKKSQTKKKKKTKSRIKKKTMKRTRKKKK